MKVRYTTSNKRLNFEFDAADTKATFEVVAGIQEIFEQEKCGNPECESDNLKFSKRTVDDNNYYELFCKDCEHKLAFGQNKVGGALFPRKWKVVDKKTGKTAAIGNFGNGWHKYTRDAEEQD